jgi:cell division septal protein FtsQ
MAYGLWRMVSMFQPYAISYQPYAKYARLASEIFLSNLLVIFVSRSGLLRSLEQIAAIKKFLTAEQGSHIPSS